MKDNEGLEENTTFNSQNDRWSVSHRRVRVRVRLVRVRVRVGFGPRVRVRRVV